MNIAFIPHVCKPGNDDRDSMKLLESYFPNENRLVMVNTEGDLDCRKLKYIISRCRFMITARTHASIAAYSTCVPTLVVGYSVKARGIAKDIFGTVDNYVEDIHSINDQEALLNKFLYILNHENEIRKWLNNKMPSYITQAQNARDLLN